MKTLKSLVLIAIALVAFSCNENRIYEEHKSEFPNYRWKKNNVVEFKPEVFDLEQRYNIYVAFRHVYGFQLKKVNVDVEMISPSGKTKKKSYKLKVMKGKGEYYSECAGDYCDLETLVEDNFKFKEVGNYIFNITYDEKLDFIPNVMQVGLVIDKVVKEAEKTKE